MYIRSGSVVDYIMMFFIDPWQAAFLSHLVSESLFVNNQIKSVHGERSAHSL